MLINNSYINMHMRSSFKPILKSLRPSEAKGQSHCWVNMGVALLGFPHGKIMSPTENRVFRFAGRIPLMTGL